MKKISFGIWLGLALLSFSTKVWPADLCGGDEKAYFSCQIKSSPKTASLCGSKTLSATQGYLQYRFGVPGKVELEYPKEKQNSQKSFRYAHYFRAQEDLTELSFDNSGHTYTIFATFNGETKFNGGKIIDDKGIRVALPGKKEKEVELLCQKPVVFHVGDLDKIVPCDKDNSLNMMGCPGEKDSP